MPYRASARAAGSSLSSASSSGPNQCVENSAIPWARIFSQTSAGDRGAPGDETLPDDAAWLPDEPEPFHPSPEDECYDVAYRLERDGIGSRAPHGLSPTAGLRWATGRRDGRKARERAKASEMGRMAGLLTGASEPPGGLKAHEAEAYRAGFKEGEAEDERDFEAWVALMEADRDAHVFGDPITDRDVYPAGCVRCPLTKQVGILKAVRTLGLSGGDEAEVHLAAMELSGPDSRFSRSSAEDLAWKALKVVRRRRLERGGEDILWDIAVTIGGGP